MLTVAIAHLVLAVNYDPNLFYNFSSKYYKIIKKLQTNNEQKMDKFHCVILLLSITLTGLDRHASLQWNMYITNP